MIESPLNKSWITVCKRDADDDGGGAARGDDGGHVHPGFERQPGRERDDQKTDGDDVFDERGRGPLGLLGDVAAPVEITDQPVDEPRDRGKQRKAERVIDVGVIGGREIGHDLVVAPDAERKQDDHDQGRKKHA